LVSLAKASSPVAPEPSTSGCTSRRSPRGLRSFSSTGMSTCAPARTVTASGTAIGLVAVVGATRKTVTCPSITLLLPSLMVMLAVPIGPGSPVSVMPLTRTLDCPTTLTLRAGVELLAPVTTRTRPVLFCTAPSTSTVVSSLARTIAVSGGTASGASAATAVSRSTADCSARVTASCTV
jgi:hypothetical protein